MKNYINNDDELKSEIKFSKTENELLQKKRERFLTYEIYEIDDSTEETLFTIERIIARKIKNKKLYYYIKWKGFSSKENTWESLEHLIEDNCFEHLYNYENLDLVEKINLLRKFKRLKELRNISESIICKGEKCTERKEFLNNYFDFNPLFKEQFDNLEYGNLDDDIIDYIIPCQKNSEEDIIFKCFWKPRKEEKNPRKPRYYNYSIIKAIDKENFHKAFYQFDQ